ncbi:MAG: alpha-amylase family glycosyl hydrolase [Bacteroidetes bacterium]|nr:alpha-amylase family glycosyl hydrolase [Bacteroidota bacterium]
MRTYISSPLTCCLAFLFSSFLHAQNVSVTFSVDMSNETVSSNGVHIAGNFQSEAGFGGDWDPNSTILSDANGDDIFDITVDIPSGTYEYKFINGNAWGSDENPPSECSVGGTNNRQITIGNTDLNIPAVAFNSCNPLLVLSVNMNGQTIAPEGVHVMGDFQVAAGFSSNWDPTSVTLQDLNGDGSYEVSLSVPVGNYQYLFVNGNTIAEAESPPTSCTIDGGSGNWYRTVNVTIGADTPPVYCFNSCDICDPSIPNNYDTFWWNDGVFYEIFVRSFYDSDNDGIGDFQGIIQKLDYLNDGDPETDTDLGVTGIWLMPMMESPSYHGYDVTNYYKTEPDYGTMADFEELIEAAHARGIKVIIDFVMNHTSNQHPWFTQSANNQNGFRDWYIWSDGNPGWNGPWGQQVWHNSGGDYYYGLFWGGMPDLNYSHPPVKEEIFNITDFWLDKGIDGFRLDAIKYLDEDGNIVENTPENFILLEEFNDVYKANNPDAFSVGEVWSNTASVIPYVQNDRLDVCFEFDLAGSIINGIHNNAPNAIGSQLATIQQSYPLLQYATFLTNHDMDRIYTQFGSNTAKMKQAAAMYLTMPGIPFIYYGEELGMTGSGIHENIRRPMQWSSGINSGFTNSNPWYGLGSNYTTNNVASMDNNPNSLLHHYRKLIHIRNDHEALRKGYILEVYNNSNILSYARIAEEEAIIVMSNFGASTNNSSISLPISSLPSGNYYVTELYNSQSLGTVTINDNGGFSNWQATGQTLGNRETWILLLSSENPLSSNNISKNIALSLFPNPVSEQLQVTLEQPENGVVEVFDSSGKYINQYPLSGGAVTVPTQQLPIGMYFIKVKIDGKIKIERFMVAR